MQTDIYSLSGIRIHDPSLPAGEDRSCLRPCGHCDRLITTDGEENGERFLAGLVHIRNILMEKLSYVQTDTNVGLPRVWRRRSLNACTEPLLEKQES
jgi:hypothetical protein